MRELRGEKARIAHRAGEDERALEGGEDLVGEGGQIDGRGRRMHGHGRLELLQEPGPPEANRGADDVRGRVAAELALVDEGDEEAARLLSGELAHAVLELVEECHELLRGVVAPGLGDGHEVVQDAHVGGGVSLDERAAELGLRPEVVEERALRHGRLREHGVDARRGEATLEHDSLRGIEDSRTSCMKLRPNHLAARHRSS
jgi:hypothetical protein